MSNRRESPFAYLRRVRERDGWTPAGVQRVLGIHADYLRLIEAGEAPLPSLGDLKRLAHLYGVPLPEFWAGLGLHDEAQRADWRPRKGDRVIIEGRDVGWVRLSDPDAELALVETRLGERFEKAWSLLAPEAQEVAA